MESMDFNPGIRVAFVNYCRLPQGQSAQAFDPHAPKLSHSQFVKLLQDVGIAEPTGSLRLSSVSVIFNSLRPVGHSRMLFPHFFKALGAVGTEANVDAYQIVADYGSRTMDLQFLTALNVFPDKGYPAVLTAAGTEGVAEVDLTEPAPAAKIFNTSSPGRVSASPRGIPVPRPRTAAAAAVAGASAGAADRVGAIQAAHIARHASQPFAGQGTVRNPSPIFQISPRATHDRPSTSRRGTSESPPATAHHYTTLSLRHTSQPHPFHAWSAHQDQTATTTHNSSPYITSMRSKNSSHGGNTVNGRFSGLLGTDMQRQLLHGFDETAAMNQKHLEQWGLLAPGKGESGDGGGGLPAWLSALLKRLDRLESQVGQQKAPTQPQPSLNSQPAGDYVSKQDLDAQLRELKDQLSSIYASQDSLTNLQHQLNSHTTKHTTKCQPNQQTNNTNDTSSLAAVEERLDTNMEKVVSTLAETGARLAAVTDETIPAMEGAMTELTSQLVELQKKVSENTASYESLKVTLARVEQDVSVDRTQLHTTTSLVDQYSTQAEQLKNNLASLEKQLQAMNTGLKTSTSIKTALATEAPSSPPPVPQTDTQQKTITHDSEQLSKRVTELESRLAEIDSALAAAKSESDGRVSDLDARVAALKVALDAVETAKSESAGGMSDLDARVTAMETAKSESEGQVSDLCARIAAVETAKGESEGRVSELEASMGELVGIIRAAAEQAEATETRTTDLDTRLKAVTATVDALSNSKVAARVGDLETKLGEMVTTVRDIAAAVPEYTQRIDELAKQLKQLDATMLAATGQDGKSEDARIGELGAKVAEHGAAIAEIAAAAPAYEKRIDELDAQLAQLAAAVAAAAAANKDNQPDTSSKVAAPTDNTSTATMIELESRLADHDAAIEEIAAAAPKYSEKIVELEAQIQQLDSVLGSLAKVAKADGRMDAFETKLMELNAAVSAAAARAERAEKASAQRPTASFTNQLLSQARGAGEQAKGDAQAAVELVSRLEEKLDKLETAHNEAATKLQALEAWVSEADSKQATGGLAPQALEQEVASATAAALEAIGLTPESWENAVKAIATLGDQLEAVRATEEAAREAQSEVLKLKVSFTGLSELLDNHSDRIEYMEKEADAMKLALERVRTVDLSEKMKLVDGVPRLDATVASQSELTALTEKVLNMENTLIRVVAKTEAGNSFAMRAMQNSLSASGIMNSVGRLTYDGEMGASGKMARSSILAADGNVAGGMTGKNALASLNPNRDKLAAAVLEVDSKLTVVDEVTKTLRSESESMKAAQEQLKTRFKEMAEALVSLSNKAQARLTKLEKSSSFSRELSGSGALDTVAEGQGDAKGAQTGTLDKRTSKRISGTGHMVSHALRTLDEGGSQLTHMNRLLAKRVDDIEERLARAEVKALANRPSLVKTEVDVAAAAAAAAAAGAAGAADADKTSALTQELRAVHQEVADLYSLLQRNEAALRQEMTQECVSRLEWSNLKHDLMHRIEEGQVQIDKVMKQVQELSQANTF